MVICEKCKLILDLGTQICPRCGRVFSATKEGIGEPCYINVALASANTHRIRGEWDEAIECCLDALKHEPKNSEAYSLLGDIYESCGKNEEAIQCFSMALELTPTSNNDRIKLDKLKEKFGRLETNRLPSQINYGGWLDRIAGGRGIDYSFRLITVVSVAFVVLLVFAGLLSFLWRSPKDEENVISAAQPTISTKQRSHIVTSADGLLPEGASIINRPSAEQQLLAAISTDPGINQRGIIVENIEFDPRVRLLIITFRASGATTKETIMADTATVASAAFSANQEMSWIMLRCYGIKPNDLNVPTPTLLFVADVERTAAVGLNAQSPPDQLLSVLTKPWWHEKVR